MRALPIILLLAAAVATAQEPKRDAASAEETRIVQSIVQCLAAGLPDGWVQARMEINLEKPFDETGAVRYLVLRSDNAEPEPFVPCDTKEPPRTLIQVRKLQPAAQRGWIGVQLSVLPDGRFRIRYGYPEQPKKK